jgi:hypothetical protein
MGVKCQLQAQAAFASGTEPLVNLIIGHEIVRSHYQNKKRNFGSVCRNIIFSIWLLEMS